MTYILLTSVLFLFLYIVIISYLIKLVTFGLNCVIQAKSGQYFLLNKTVYTLTVFSSVIIKRMF